MASQATETVTSAELWGGNRSPFSVSYGKLMIWFFLVSDALTFTGFLVGFGFARHTYQGEWPVGEQVFQAIPFFSGSFPLIFVAFMTFLLIVSSVTMVLAVEAGHRMDRKGVTLWLGLTLLGGLTFLGSQAWEWSHFIHGTPGYIITNTNDQYWLTEEIPHGKTAADVENFGLIANKGTADENIITGERAVDLYGRHLLHVQGANMTENEYGPVQYANFFFFITGFHGFHVSIGVLLLTIAFISVLRGVYHRRGHYEMVEKVGLYWHFVDLVWVFVFTFFYLV